VALVTAWLLVALSGPWSPRADAEAPDTAPSHGPVLVIGVPDLRWQDLDPVHTPALWDLAGRSSIGAMTDQSGEGDTRRATGWLVLGTGTRAVAGVLPSTVPDAADPAQLAALRQANANAHYRAQVGALGDAVHKAGKTIAAVGPGAVLGAMTSRGTVDETVTSLGAPLPRADVVVLELPQIYDTGRHGGVASASALTAVDTAVESALRQLPSGASVLLAGVSDGADGGAPLHVAMASGPAFGTGRLTSPSTGRDGVVQLIDVAPTILSLLGAPVPSSMVGVHWQSVDEARTPVGSQVAGLIDLDQRSRAEVRMGGPYAQAVLVVSILYLLFVLWGWSRRRTGPPLALSAIVASVPVGSWLTQLVPWWRGATWTLLPLGAAFAVVVGVSAALSPWPRDPRWRIAGFVGAVTAAVIVLDAATGSPLSLDAPFGDNPIIAGRFHGIGNVAFALLGAGTLLLAATLVAGRSGPRSALTVLGLGAVAVAVDGYPGLGDDFGGVLALLPAVCVLALLVSGVRVSWRYVVGIPAVTVVMAAVFALVDYARPAAERTHLGRFVQQIADGTAWDVMHRKLGSSLHTFAAGWPRWITLVWLLLVVVGIVRLRRGRLRMGPDVDVRTTRGLAIALAVLAVLGAGLNDSGLAVTAFVLAVAVPLLVPQVDLPPAENSEPEEGSEQAAAGPQDVTAVTS
jgi:hypothetical protein